MPTYNAYERRSNVARQGHLPMLAILRRWPSSNIAASIIILGNFETCLMSAVASQHPTYNSGLLVAYTIAAGIKIGLIP